MKNKYDKKSNYWHCKGLDIWENQKNSKVAAFSDKERHCGKRSQFVGGDCLASYFTSGEIHVWPHWQCGYSQLNHDVRPFTMDFSLPDRVPTVMLAHHSYQHTCFCVQGYPVGSSRGRRECLRTRSRYVRVTAWHCGRSEIAPSSGLDAESLKALSALTSDISLTLSSSFFSSSFCSYFTY